MNTTNSNKWLIWLVGVFFLLFQFFLQLSSGIVIGTVMHDMQLSAFTAGLLSSSFYYVYTTLQLPVGILFDRYNTRNLLAINAGLCALGCFFFASGHSLLTLFLGRLIIGGGSAFAFVGLSHLLRQHFPLRHYGFIVGLSETLGFTLTVTGMIGMGTFIESFGWRFFIYGTGFVGLLIALLCWLTIPSNKPIAYQYNAKQQILSILKNKLVWINGIFVGLEFSVITVFGALWSVPFLQLKLKCSLQEAGMISSMILLGAGLSCPVFGYIASQLTRRKPLIHFSCLFSALLLLVVLYYPIEHVVTMGILLFLTGLSCGAYMLAYSISNELAPAKSLSTCTGFTNTLAMTSAPLMQPLIGYILDRVSTRPGNYILQDYQCALLLVPIALVTASILSQWLPEKVSYMDAHGSEKEELSSLN